MRLLAHRGLWSAEGYAQNSLAALDSALAEGCGVETDVRDFRGEVVISHDVATDQAPRLTGFLDRVSEGCGPLALNIKSDGLAEALAARFESEASRASVFFFDMSVPDTRAYLRLGLPVYTRHSDVEPMPAYYGQAKGIWLDELEMPWITRTVIDGHLAVGKKVAVVSPELHGRAVDASWSLMKPFSDHPGVYLCTDLIREAREYFDL